MQTHNENRTELTEKHSFVQDFIFRFKTYYFTFKRSIQNFKNPVKQFSEGKNLKEFPVISFSESDLWNANDNAENWILTAGKIQNLRIATQKLNGLEIKANEVFSFWKHIGNPNFGTNYVVGREIREGCILPTKAGGLCQLSNALYDAALNANFEIVERHKHTRIIQGSLAEKDRDATVKWNYVDLRFKSKFDFRIEIELTLDQLIVVYKSARKSENLNLKEEEEFTTFHHLNDCYSCGNTTCFKHPDRSSVKKEKEITTYILDERWLEFDDFIGSIKEESSVFILPFKSNKLLKTNRYSWNSALAKQTKYANYQGFRRAIVMRYFAKNKNPFELSLELDEKMANSMAKQIPVASTHLVISQNLLPFLLKSGALGGRTFDVLMTRLPIEKLHERLDFAHAKYAESPTLKDFRASDELIELESKALTKARKIITPHSEIEKIFWNKTIKLNWKIPMNSESTKSKGNKVLFPASAVGRKGAYEIRKLAKEFNLDLVILGNAVEKDNFWEDVKVEKFNGNWNEIGLVIYPTYIENQPRQILKVISKGIPVITTEACGIAPKDKISILEIGNYENLRNEVQNYLQKKSSIFCHPEPVEGQHPTSII